MTIAEDAPQTIEVPEKDRFDEAKLTAWMVANVEGFEPPLSYAKFAGGQSNPTFKISAPSGEYVLRRKPFGNLLPSAHAVDREYRVIAGLYPTGFPVARPYGLCTDPDVLGTDFYVMGFADGRNLWDGTLPDYAPDERAGVYNAMCDALAALHNTDHVAAGLGDYGRPGNYFERQVARWTRQYRASQTDDLAVVEKLMDFLGRTASPQTRTSIIHGDYRIDNLIYAPDRPEIIAVVDWELSTLGDPLADFAYLAMNWTMPRGDRAGLAGVDFAATGVPTLAEITVRYCEKTGRDGVPDLEWYFAYNLFRLMSIVQGIKKRMIDGNAAGADAQATVDRLIPLADAAWTHARAAGADA